MNMTSFTTEDPLSAFPWATTDGAEYDYEDLMCDRESVRAFRSWWEPLLFWIITLVGGAGNLAVVWAYMNVRGRLKTMSDVYLLNLALADLLFLVTLPLWAQEALKGWNFGLVVCKLTSALYKVNLFSSLLLLTLISIDRYWVIVHTTKMQNSQLERRRCGLSACAGVWLLALVLAIPELLFATIKDVDSQQHCTMVYPNQVGNLPKIVVLGLQVTMGFCVPFIIMVFFYSVVLTKLLTTRSFQKHKAMRVVLAVVLVFMVSQLPHNAVLVMKAVQASNMTLTDCEDLKRLDVVGQVLKSVAYTHACLNPILYAFVGVRFRRDVLHLLRCCCRRPLPLVKSPRNSTPASVMSDSDTSQAMSL